MKQSTISVALVAVLCAVCLPLAGQDNLAPAPAHSVRLLLLRRTSGAAPGHVKLTVRLINGADADLMLPKPVINCGSDDGYVMVIHKLLSPAKRPETGGGCASDRWSRRDVLAEAHKWVTLAPGAVFDMPIELMFANPAARYEVRATYFPARFTPEELNSLAGHGINVVQAGAESEPLIIKSQH